MFTPTYLDRQYRQLLLQRSEEVADLCDQFACLDGIDYFERYGQTKEVFRLAVNLIDDLAIELESNRE